MAPEQWTGQTPTPAVDQYSLGAVLYTMLTGHPPFDADNPFALMNKHLNETPPPIQRDRPNVPDRINAVIQQAMAKKPEDRFPNNTLFAEAFAAVIHDASDETATGFAIEPMPERAPIILLGATPTPIKPPIIPEVPVPPPIPSGRGRNLTLWILTGLVLLLAIALIVLFTSRQPILVGVSTNPGCGDWSYGYRFTHRLPRRDSTIAGRRNLPGKFGAALSKSSDTPTSTNLPTRTSTVTDTPTNTPTPKASDTATFTATTSAPSGTETPIAIATSSTPMVRLIYNIAAHSGPGQGYPAITTAPINTEMIILGKIPNQSWFYILLPDGRQAWIASSSVVYISGDLSHVLGTRN